MFHPVDWPDHPCRNRIRIPRHGEYIDPTIRNHILELSFLCSLPRSGVADSVVKVMYHTIFTKRAS